MCSRPVTLHSQGGSCDEKTSMPTAEFEAADKHFARVKEGRTQSIETSSIHLDIVRDLRRINSHLISVAYPILKAAGELAQSRLLDTSPAASLTSTANLRCTPMTATWMQIPAQRT
jgi:hypothetical protein